MILSIVFPLKLLIFVGRRSFGTYFGDTVMRDHIPNAHGNGVIVLGVLDVPHPN